MGLPRGTMEKLKGGIVNALLPPERRPITTCSLKGGGGVSCMHAQAAHRLPRAMAAALSTSRVSSEGEE